METILKKAKEGGWIPKPREITYLENLEKYTDTKMDFRFAILDPLFWQALGKACGWEWGYCKDEDSTYHDQCIKCIHRRFHEINLTEGWEKAVKYLEDICT